ncbi:hypothetical protein [Roseicella aerolata]|uniref:Uncharacterized protein n=1 Tax=Roseicella aerolata TaxID=2883479 RepID=A0A9X1ICV0_9PROT|nr:hypothetical protein [Roseicella aerolata]MCB4822062.1 hypothetical protein [Roseicella aerolata]
MALSLILHDLSGLTPDDQKRFFEAIFQIAPGHWQVAPGATLAETGVSPAYLRDHLLKAVPPAQRAGTRLLVTRTSPDTAWHALSPEGEDWLREMMAEG